MESLGKEFDTRSWLKYAVSGIGGLLLVAGGAFMPGAFWWGFTLAAVGLVVVEGATYVYDQYTIREDARKTLMQALHSLVTHLESGKPLDQQTVRANLMLVDGDGLRIAYHIGAYDDSELRLRWHKPQGCCGSAWERRRTVFAPEDMDPPELPIDPNNPATAGRWNMSDEQIRVSATIGAVISVPVPRRETGEIVGVLNVDDSKPVKDSVLGQTEQATIETFGCSIPPILERAGFDFPFSY